MLLVIVWFYFFWVWWMEGRGKVVVRFVVDFVCGRYGEEEEGGSCF